MISKTNSNEIVINELKIEIDKYKMQHLEIDKHRQEILNLNRIISNDNNSYNLSVSELKEKNIQLNNDILL